VELTNEFRVDVPVEEAWAILTDVERIAPCMPGAELQEIEGDEYRGIVKVKVGPITAQYKGKATFVDKDDTGHKAVLRAEGRDTRGQGNANATITATLEADGTGTKVSVVTDLAVTGRVAQFGRGVLADVSAKLLGQFVDCLHNDVLSGNATTPAEPPPGPPSGPPSGPPPGPDPKVANAASSAMVSGPATAVALDDKPVPAPDAPSEPQEPTIRKIESRPAQPVDLLDAAGGSMAKRFAPIGIGLLLLLLLVRRRRRRRR
jgi:carbon monoxide dehydrogenase subunit G